MRNPSSSHYEGQDLEALADLPHYTGWILDQYAGVLRGRVLEVGAGIGNVADRYVDRVDTALLVEPAANLCTTLRARMAARPHVTVVQSLLADVPAPLLAEPFDAVVLVNVLEHIQDDAAILQHIQALLKPGGALCLFVPAHPQLYGSLDKLVDHVRRYRKQELRDKLQDAGLRVDKLHYLDTLGMAPWLLAGKVFRRQQYDELGAKAYDRLGVPVTRALEQAYARLAGQPPLGKSLVAVAVKPG